MSGSTSTPLFDFMLLRPPVPVEPVTLFHHYIHDEPVLAVPEFGSHVPIPSSIATLSAVGKIVHHMVFCEKDATKRTLEFLLQELLDLVPTGVMSCGGDTEPHVEQGTVLQLEDLHRGGYLLRGQTYYLLPDRLERLMHVPLVAHLPALAATLNELRAHDFDGERLMTRVRHVFDGEDLTALVYGAGLGRYTGARRGLFDALYLLYMLRRWTPVDLEPVLGALRLLHLLRALAVDAAYDRLRSGHGDALDAKVMGAVSRALPGLAGWDGSADVDELPLIASVDDLDAHLRAVPVVHAIFARLLRYPAPFNDINPVGIGDLKVVRQSLVEYSAGEISHIHNVMQGETKERTHRRLERTEDVFSFTSGREDEMSSDTQSTDRNELKRETENVLRSSLNVGANASVQYNHPVVVATVGATFASGTESSGTAKVAQNFSREVVSKAVSRVVSRVTEQRSVTKTYESEEVNKHAFTAPGQHISGIYQWVDKRYKAQLFNYGKRMMFEFVLPEPAAMYVEARLRAFEDALIYPQRPEEPPVVEVVMPVERPGQIDEATFEQLRLEHDLSSFSYPVDQKVVPVVDSSGNALFSKRDTPNSNDFWHVHASRCNLRGRGYQLDQISVTGRVEFHDKTSSGNADRNLVRIQVEGVTVFSDESQEKNLWYDGKVGNGPIVLPRDRDDVDVHVLLNDVWNYDLAMVATLSRTPQHLEDWQSAVYTAIYKEKKGAVDAENRANRMRHDSAMSNYQNEVAEIRGNALNDLLAGRSEDANRQVITTELRRQCLSMLTKEFDVDTADDVLSQTDPTGTFALDRSVTRLDVHDDGETLTVSWENTPVPSDYPAIDIPKARTRARHVQFLEQAFEWGRLAFQFYPYFWAAPKRWMAMLDRSDPSDQTMSAFLQAGAVRVLVSVTPAYDQAVLHYLATREPWDGGDAPAIGDPLFLPLHEELRRQQDDRAGGVPEGDGWEFTVPTSLVYLNGSSNALPPVAQPDD